MTEKTGAAKRNNKTALLSGAAVAAAALVVVVVLPAGFSIDPTGLGSATGLLKERPIGERELELGMERMETEEVLTLMDEPLEPLPGIRDVWEYELEPFESLELKYTMAEDEPMVFRWEATAPVNYDMHSHPFEGGVEMTESYSIDEAQVMQGRYIAPFTGIHGWYWDNRSVDPVTVRLEASGGMTHSTIFGGGGQTERPLEGVGDEPLISADQEMQD